jgi:hypothetical protein
MLEENSNPSLSSSFNVYPFPTSIKIPIAFSADNEKGYTIRLMDITERVVIHENQTCIVGDNQYQMNLANIAKSVYVLVMQKGDAILQKKMVVL